MTDPTPRAPQSHADVVNLWKSAEMLAERLREKGVTVRQWRNRNSIPVEKWPAIIAAATSDHGVTLTMEQMLEMSRGHGDAQGGDDHPDAPAVAAQ